MIFYMCCCISLQLDNNKLEALTLICFFNVFQLFNADLFVMYLQYDSW